MTEYSAGKVVWSSRVRDAFGPVVELQDEESNASYYEVEREFDLDEAAYAVLRPENGSRPEEPEIFKILTGTEGSLELVTIEDDEEWENIAELYDELTFPE